MTDKTVASSAWFHMHRGNLDPASADTHGPITKQSAELDGVTATRVSFGPGVRWFEDLNAYEAQSSCRLSRVALVQESRLRLLLDDGSEESFGCQDAMLMPPGHDVLTLDDEPCLFVEFSRGNDLYSASA